MSNLLFKVPLLVLLSLAWVWGVLALYFNFPGPDGLRLLVVVLFALALPACLIFTQFFNHGLVVCLVLYCALLVWWHSIEPTDDKEWAPDVARVSHGEITGSKLTMYNVRNFDYEAEDSFTEHWETREYDLNKLKGLDFFLSYWASEHIAHVIVSWDFGDAGPLAISIETRKDMYQEYSAIKGFFKQYELSYVAADEEDIIRLRTDIRKERVYGYRLATSKELALALLREYLWEMNRLNKEPEFYDALTRNCTTTIHLHNKAIRPDSPPPLDWRILASGHLDELIYERGTLDRSLPFTELRQQSRIERWEEIEDGSAYFRRNLHF